MTPDDIERILAADDTVKASPNFARNAMAAVYRDAAEPPPRLFPWGRFALGLGACGSMATTATVVLSGSTAASLGNILGPIAEVVPELSCGAAVVVIALGLLAVPRVFSRL